MKQKYCVINNNNQGRILIHYTTNMEIIYKIRQLTLKKTIFNDDDEFYGFFVFRIMGKYMLPCKTKLLASANAQ